MDLEKGIWFIENEKNSAKGNIYKKEYDKVYKRLSRKYSGSELEYKVKQKMYALGFTNNSFD